MSAPLAPSIVAFAAGLLVDLNTKLTAASAKALAAASWSPVKGEDPLPVKGVFRYVGLHGPAAGDIDAAEVADILGAGLLLGLVQHCFNPGWVASEPLGTQLGQAAVACAKAAGYAPGGMIALDLEGCASIGAPVAEYCEAWAKAVIAAGYVPLLYVGYSCGLTPEELWELPSFHSYWSDFGPRNVARRGFVLKQHAQTTLAGLEVDPDVASTDALGGMLMLMAA